MPRRRHPVRLAARFDAPKHRYVRTGAAAAATPQLVDVEGTVDILVRRGTRSERPYRPGTQHSR